MSLGELRADSEMVTRRTGAVEIEEINRVVAACALLVHRRFDVYPCWCIAGLTCIR